MRCSASELGQANPPVQDIQGQTENGISAMAAKTSQKEPDKLMQCVDVDGSRVRVLRTRRESSEDPPLLLINGMAARLEMWQPLCAAIPDRPLLMFDFPGITGSPARDLPIEMPGLARWLGRLLDVLEVEKAVVLGYSWGGVLAQQFARDAPERLGALILASTNFGFGTVHWPERWPPINLMPSKDGDDPWKLITAAFGGPPGSRNPIGAMVNAFTPYTTSIEGYQRQFLSLTGWTSLPWLGELKVSTLVVAGDDDHYVPTSTTRRLAQSIPRARLQLIPGGGHLLPINQPNRLAQAIDHFLS